MSTAIETPSAPADFSHAATAAPADFDRAAAHVEKRASVTFPSQGFALFPGVDGAVDVRVVEVTAVFEGLGAASVTERVGLSLRVGHVLPLSRVASADTLAAKRATYARTLSLSARPAQRPSKMPVTTTGRAALSA